MKFLLLSFAFAGSLALAATGLTAEVPQYISYQGRVAVGGVSFQGAGLFKFALVNGDGTATYWSNDGTSVNGSEPAASVTINVTNGLYNVLLGDTSLANMTPVTDSAFGTSDVRLRIWFNDGVNGFEQFNPDQRIAAVGYAMVAANVRDGAIGADQIAPGAINNTHLAPESVSAANLKVPAAPAAGQVLGFNGDTIAWGAPGAGDGIWALNNANAFYNAGSVGIGTSTPDAKLDVRGNVVLDAGGNPVICTGIGSDELKRYLLLINSNGHPSASGLKAGGVLVSDSYAYADPGKNDMIVKGSVGIGVPYAFAPLHVDTDWSSAATGKPNVYLTGSEPTVQWTAQASSFLDLGSVYSWIAHLGTGSNRGLEFWSRYQNQSRIPFTDSGWVSRVTFTRDGDITYVGKLGKLDTLEQFSSTVRSADFLLGHSQRRGSPGRAMVDWKDAAGKKSLVINFANDWPETHIGGAVTEVQTLRIVGGADLAEPFPMSQEDVPPGAVVVIDEQHPGKLRMSHAAFDKKVAGIVSGANGIQPGISMIQENALEPGKNVALSGRVHVRANTSGGRIEPGDLLTSSDVPGEAMKAFDHGRAQGAILGKAMTGLSEGSGSVLVIVTLQ